MKGHVNLVLKKNETLLKNPRLQVHISFALPVKKNRNWQGIHSGD